MNSIVDDNNKRMLDSKSRPIYSHQSYISPILDWRPSTLVPAPSSLFSGVHTIPSSDFIRVCDGFASSSFPLCFFYAVFFSQEWGCILQLQPLPASSSADRNVVLCSWCGFKKGLLGNHLQLRGELRRWTSWCGFKIVKLSALLEARKVCIRLFVCVCTCVSRWWCCCVVAMLCFFFYFFV